MNQTQKRYVDKNALTLLNPSSGGKYYLAVLPAQNPERVGLTEVVYVTTVAIGNEGNPERRVKKQFCSEQQHQKYVDVNDDMNCSMKEEKELVNHDITK
jgi:hypothetical protein